MFGEMEDITDRISEIPESIAHHILSFLDSSADLVRLTVLSKRWFALTVSFPILDFDFSIFEIFVLTNSQVILYGISLDPQYVRDIFFEYVAYSLSRFCEQTVIIDTFKLIIELHEPREVDIVERYLGSILRKGVQSSLIVDVVKFKSLKVLDLYSINIDEEVIKYLTTCCPLLEEFSVRCCYGLKFFYVYGHRYLQKVWIDYLYQVERIDIEAINLCNLILIDLQGRDAPSVNVASCEKLTTLYYINLHTPKSKGVSEILSNFPFIENMSLHIPHHCNMKLSSPSLKTFVVAQVGIEANSS
ncbi:F-box domain containing protein [Tanacetum coccineum]